MRERNASGDAPLPPALMRSGPRPVRLSAAGTIAAVSMCVVLGLAGWFAAVLHQQAAIAERHVGLFATESVETSARVVDIRRQGENNARVHYAYSAGGETYRGTATVRRRERERYVVGADVVVRYLRSDPGSSWLSGHAPRRRSAAGAFVLTAGSVLGFAAVAVVIRRQWRLLEYGRPALAVVTGAEKRRSDKGTYWRVHYQWTLLSGAKRRGRFNHAKKAAPAAGTRFVIVYDRDNPDRHHRYPMSLVAL